MANPHHRRSVLAGIGSVTLLSGCLDDSEDEPVDYTPPEDADFSIDVQEIDLPDFSPQSALDGFPVTTVIGVTNESGETAEYVSLRLRVYATYDGITGEKEDTIYRNSERIGDVDKGETVEADFEFEVSGRDGISAQRADCEFDYEVEISYSGGEELHGGEHSVNCDS